MPQQLFFLLSIMYPVFELIWVVAAMFLFMFGLAAVVMSPVIMYYGWTRYRSRYIRVRDAADPDSQSSETRDGAVLVNGTATKEEHTVTPLLGSDDALCTISNAYGFHPFPASVNFIGWHTIAYRIRSARFGIQTETSKFLFPSVREQRSSAGSVGFAGIWYHIRRGLSVGSGLQLDTIRSQLPEVPWRFDTDGFDEVITVRHRDRDTMPTAATKMEQHFDLPPAEKPFIPGIRIPGPIGGIGTRRFGELTIEEGDEITIVGNVETRSGNSAPVLTNPEGKRLLISTLTPDELQRRYRRLWWLFVSFPFVIVPVVVVSYLTWFPW